MQYRQPTTTLATHDVSNQAPPFEDVNRYATDRALRDAVAHSGAGFAADVFSDLGERVGSAEIQEAAAQANRCPPQLNSFDRVGQRIDEVEFHPAWHTLMRLGIEAGVSSIAGTAPAAGHSAHSVLLYLMTAADAGVCCPFSMTYAAIPLLRRDPELAGKWLPRVLAARYDPSSRPVTEKPGVTVGMAMTEKQGGSDVRANTTRAAALADDFGYRLTGHKWFCSAPMSDAFLTLAQSAGGLSCFFVPRWQPDGRRNPVHLVRLKDKLGDRSNASAEIEYHGAWARRVGEEGQGVRTIIDMVQGTRLDCIVGSAALMRNALASAIWHCERRSAFGIRLAALPAMRRVLADLVLEQEAALALAFRVARAFDESPADEAAAGLARILTPIAKYWVCKRAPAFICEAMECHGGNGFVEESPLPRWFRQSPLNGIWEGSGNVIALDALRAIRRQPTLLDCLLTECAVVKGYDRRLDRWLERLPDLGRELRDADARQFVESAALAAQAAALAAHAPRCVFEGFIAARIALPARTFGASPAGVDEAALLERASAGAP